MRILIVVDFQDPILANETTTLAQTLAAVGHTVTLLSTASEHCEGPAVSNPRVQFVEPWTQSFLRGLPHFVRMIQDLRPDVVHFYHPRGLRNCMLAQWIVSACTLLKPRMFATLKEAPGALVRTLLVHLEAIFVPYRSLAHELSTLPHHPAIWVLPTLLQVEAQTVRDPRRTLVVPASPREIDHFEILISEVGQALRDHPTWSFCLLDPCSELMGRARRRCWHQLQSVQLENRTTILTGSGWQTQMRSGVEAGLLCVAPLGLSSRLWEPMISLALRSHTPLLANTLQAELSYYQWPGHCEFLTGRPHGQMASRIQSLLHSDSLRLRWQATAAAITAQSEDPTNALLRLYVDETVRHRSL